MVNFLQKTKEIILSLYLVFAVWTPTLWFISAIRIYHKMESFGFENLFELNLFEIPTLLFLLGCSFISKFYLFQIRFDKTLFAFDLTTEKKQGDE